MHCVQQHRPAVCGDCDGAPFHGGAQRCDCRGSPLVRQARPGTGPRNVPPPSRYNQPPGHRSLPSGPAGAATSGGHKQCAKIIVETGGSTAKRFAASSPRRGGAVQVRARHDPNSDPGTPAVHPILVDPGYRHSDAVRSASRSAISSAVVGLTATSGMSAASCTPTPCIGTTQSTYPSRGRSPARTQPRNTPTSS